MLTLALLFLVTAVLYASVGLGGGSTYNALLVLADTDYRILPSVALACNLIVLPALLALRTRRATRTKG